MAGTFPSGDSLLSHAANQPSPANVPILFPLRSRDMGELSLLLALRSAGFIAKLFLLWACSKQGSSVSSCWLWQPAHFTACSFCMGCSIDDIYEPLPAPNILSFSEINLSRSLSLSLHCPQDLTICILYSCPS